MLVLSDPVIQLAFLAMSMLAARFALPKRQAFKLAVHSAFFVILTALLLSHGIEPYSTSAPSGSLWRQLFFALAKTIWWFSGATMLVSSIRLFVIFERRPREAKLIQDMLAGIIYVGAILSVISYIFGVPVGTLIATSGAFAIILGLALQSSLSDVFSGIALNLGRPYSVGDWIMLENGTQGRVVETNWRATHLLNAANDLVVIPNNLLAKSQLVNLNNPDESHGITMPIRLIPTRSPGAIEQLLETVLLASNRIMHSPAPMVTITGLDGDVIEADLSFRIKDVSQSSTAKNEIYDLIYRHAHAAGISLALRCNALSETLVRPEKPIDAVKESSAILLKAMQLFCTLTEAERETLMSSIQQNTYPRGSEILAQGERSSALMIVAKGVVAIRRRYDGTEIELNRLSPGDFFGERGVLMGAEEPGRAVSLTQLVVYRVSSDCFSEIMQKRPALADEIGQILAERLEKEKRLVGVGDETSSHPNSLADRIRYLFHLPHVVSPQRPSGR